MLFDARKLIKRRLPFLGELNKPVYLSKLTKLVLKLSIVVFERGASQRKQKQGAPRGALFHYNSAKTYAAGGMGGAPGAGV